MNKSFCHIVIILLFVVYGCRDDKEVLTPEIEQVTTDENKNIVGFYLLNEGNMGSNKASLDFFNYSTGTYARNIYANANPNMAQELGDVGNDVEIYGERLYAVINCSNIIEVMDAHTAEHIGSITLPNCRYVRFYGRYGYATSYAGPVEINPNYAQRGYVAKFDTATLQIVDTCLVGFQPDELEIVNNKIYVANSGGYMTPNYETTISVIDINSFQELKRIEVACNLHRLKTDNHNQLWVSNRGDYLNQPSRLYCIDLATEQVTDTIDVAVSGFDIYGDSLYVYGAEFSYETYDNIISYAIVDVVKHKLLTNNFITDNTDKTITMPYGIKINQRTGEILLTDAKDYVSPGSLCCFSNKGELKWSVTTGDIPSDIAFLYE